MKNETKIIIALLLILTSLCMGTSAFDVVSENGVVNYYHVFNSVSMLIVVALLLRLRNKNTEPNESVTKSSSKASRKRIGGDAPRPGDDEK